jgi:rhodanese-related sulfurtransferase
MFNFNMEEITAIELKKWIDEGSDFQLIDVREPHEAEIARIPQAKLIPLGSLPSRLEEIDAGKTTVVHCRSGVRSAKAIEFLRAKGFENRLLNLKGGILAWSDEVDPTVPKY